MSHGLNMMAAARWKGSVSSSCLHGVGISRIRWIESAAGGSMFEPAVFPSSEIFNHRAYRFTLEKLCVTARQTTAYSNDFRYSSGPIRSVRNLLIVPQI